MVVKLNSLARWTALPATDAIVFDGSDVAERRVRINFNLEAVTSFFIGDETGESFLCTLGPGLDTVEFNIAGSFKVYAEKGSGIVQYQSADLEPTHAEVVDPVIFTKIAQRRHRNPELEEMMFRMQANMERRFALQADEIAAQYARQLKEIEDARAAETVVAPAPVAAGGSEVPAQGAAGEKPGETAGAPVAGEQPGGGSGASA
ncbi:hypothetical protein FHT82_000003 [Rhizobium sp. BK275]|uniref:hypothetical protein n=1 Tax=Rhizobium sp. BK275 TaxID=2587077 RepID=UPI0017BEB582|nr:hypothetical protein [Rhizobium sp. BK275]MBB3387283.1 hypothetical protein [Rhizobium sp. BK275]